MANSTIYSEMEFDGRVHKPGSRLAGPMSYIETTRKRSDASLSERGHEYGRNPQKLPARDSPEGGASDSMPTTTIPLQYRYQYGDSGNRPSNKKPRNLAVFHEIPGFCICGA